ncbi:MAG: PaaI family thioesterase [Deltaproteobacteria bacterium]|nr:PaaI family thioesterase [Deltaproteobacteria bacterium]
MAKHHPFAELLGVEIVSVGAGRAVAEIQADERLHNPNGVVHGATVFALADTSMGAAVHSLLSKGEACASIEVHVRYFRSVRTGRLRAETTVIFEHKRIMHLESHVRTVDGTLVAFATGSFAVLGPSSEK